jgi:tetratricopeptide (TPR) repeat protein
VKTRAWIAVGLAIGLAWTAAAPVRAEDNGAPPEVARAEAFAADAFNAYARKDYAAAIDLYQRALAAAPSADIVYNIARIYDLKLKNRVLAIEHYQRYAQDTGADPNRLRVVSARLRELRELESIAATADARTPEAAREAVESQQSENAGVTAGSAATMTTGEAAGPQQSSRDAPPRAAREPALSSVQVVGIMTGAVGLAGLGLGIGFGLKAKSDADEAKRFCEGNICRSQRGVDASRTARDAATVSTIAFVAGGALTLLGVAAVLLGLNGPAEREGATTWTPYATPDGAGALLASRW